MRRNRLWLSVLALGTLTVTGCSGRDNPGAGDAGNPAAGGLGARYLLSAEPGDALGVAEARKTAGDGDDLTVVGRVGGAEDPFVEGAAGFVIADESLKPCNDGCPMPWDYCCSPGLVAGKALVTVVDEQGGTVAADARTLLGLKELDTVVVRGRASRDEAGNLTVLADGIYVRR